MKKVVYSILGGALLLALPMFLTSCDDILGEWSKPTPTIITPETPVKVTSITLNKPTTTLNVGTTETLKVDAFAPDDATDKSVTWSSDKDAVATVDENGLVTAVAVGTAVITATAKDGSGVTDKCTVTVSVPGLLSGEFSIASDKRVRFAQGNLQATYDGTSSWTWAFANNQWDYIGGHSGNITINGNGTLSAAGTVDLFGWVGASNNAWEGDLGTTGNAAMHGISNVVPSGSDEATTVSDYGNVSGENLKSDWGKTIDESGTSWRTLTKNEWEWLIGKVSPTPGTNCRTSSTIGGVENARWVKAFLHSANGLIIFPDEFTWDVSTMGTAPTTCNTKSNAFAGYSPTDDQWTALESAGCVFLPAAGRRVGASVFDAGDGRYGMSTNGSWNYCNTLNFSGGEVNTGGEFGRYNGFSIRLVHDVK